MDSLKEHKAIHNDLILHTIFRNCDAATLTTLRSLSRYFEDAVTTFIQMTGPSVFSVNVNSRQSYQIIPSFVSLSLVRNVHLELGFDETSEAEFPARVSEFLENYHQFIEELKVSKKPTDIQTICFLHNWKQYGFPNLKSLDYKGDPKKTATKEENRPNGNTKTRVTNMCIVVSSRDDVKFQFTQELIKDCPNLKTLRVQSALLDVENFCNDLTHLDTLELEFSFCPLSWIMTFSHEFKGFANLRKLCILSDAHLGQFHVESRRNIFFPNLEDLEVSHREIVFSLSPLAQFPKLKSLKTVGTKLLSSEFGLLKIEKLHFKMRIEYEAEKVEDFLKVCLNLKSLTIYPSYLFPCEKLATMAQKILKVVQSSQKIRQLEVCLYHPMQNVGDQTGRQVTTECLKTLRDEINRGNLEKLTILCIFEDGFRGEELNDVSNQYIYTLFSAVEKEVKIVLKGNEVLRRMKPFLLRGSNSMNVQLEFQDEASA